MALDITANVGTVIEHTAEEAILMVAYSQGAKQLLAALDRHKGSMTLVSVAALLAPCVNDSDLDSFVSQTQAKEVIQTMWQEKTFVIGGIGWELAKDRLCLKMTKGACTLLDVFDGM